MESLSKLWNTSNVILAEYICEYMYVYSTRVRNESVSLNRLLAELTISADNLYKIVMIFVLLIFEWEEIQFGIWIVILLIYNELS